MKLNRFLSILAAASLAFSFTSCSDDKDDNDNQGDNNPVVNPDKPGTGTEDPVAKPDPVAAASAAKEAETYLDTCDFKTASEKLEAAYKADKTNADIAFQRSILGLINLVNNANVQSVLKDFGFTGSPVDFSVIMQSDGIFKQMVSEEPEWDTIGDKIPHPAINGDKSFSETLNSSLTFGKIIDALNNMDNDLLSLAESFETAAKGVTGNQLIAIEKAGCSLNEIKFGAADLYLFAALIRTTMAAVDWASAYDFDINVKKYYDFEYGDFEEYTNIADATKSCNSFKSSTKFITDHLFKVKSADAGKDGRKHLAAAALDIKAAAELAPNVSKDAFFGWYSLKSGALTDIKSIAQKVIDSEDGSKVISISQITPALNLDLTKLFDKAIAPSRALESSCEIGFWCNTFDDDYNCTENKYYINQDLLDDDLLNAFFGEDILNTISGAKIYSYDTDQECINWHKQNSDLPAEVYTQYCTYGSFNSEYSHNFSSAWNDFYPHQLFYNVILSDDDKR